MKAKAEKLAKKPKYVIGMWKPGDECCLGLYQPRFCSVIGPRGGTRFCCSMFNVCKEKVYVNEKIELQKP